MLELAQQITALIGPVVPYLLIGGTKAAEKAGEKLGADVWDKVKDIWKKLCSDKADHLGEIARDLAVDPENNEIKQAFAEEVKKLIEENPDLAIELASLVESQVIQNVLAEQNSSIKGVRQSTTGSGGVRMEVIARNGSSIEDVEQKHNAR